LKFLWQLTAAARTQLDPFTWIKEGGLDAEEFLECVESGRWHPLLRRWHVMKGTSGANRPAPTSRDRIARRLVVLAVIALQRVISTDGYGARRTVAAAMAKMFEDAPSAETIHHWSARRSQPQSRQPRRSYWRWSSPALTRTPRRWSTVSSRWRIPSSP